MLAGLLALSASASQAKEPPPAWETSADETGRSRTQLNAARGRGDSRPESTARAETSPQAVQAPAPASAPTAATPKVAPRTDRVADRVPAAEADEARGHDERSAAAGGSAPEVALEPLRPVRKSTNSGWLGLLGLLGLAGLIRRQPRRDETRVRIYETPETTR
jgi:hypothetical protein